MFIGKTVVITGAAVGIGRAAALQFAKKGANVAILDVNEEKLNILKNEMSMYADRVKKIICDVSDEQSVKEVFSQITAEFGKIDILVNNAALWRKRLQKKWQRMESL